jgi:hypothetical protein
MLNVMVATLNMLEVTVDCDWNFECRSLKELLRVYLYTIEMERLNQNISQSSFKAARCYSPKILTAVTNIMMFQPSHALEDLLADYTTAVLVHGAVKWHAFNEPLSKAQVLSPAQEGVCLSFLRLGG